MTDFDEYLQKRNAAESMKARDSILLFAEAGKEWQRLKDRVREITAGKSLGVEKFEWSPYPAPYPDFLKLKDVAATFIAKVAAGTSAQNFRVVFSRRPLRADDVVREEWSDEDPIPARTWLLNLKPTNGIFCWSQKQSAAKWTTEGFAGYIAQQLVEYYEAYTSALKAKYPWVNF
ncbi:MAG: hypothetical protein ABSA48_04060 [Terracidiphilus sp.]|jgi:hypothetical protein